jgi:hypothetical protein
MAARNADPGARSACAWLAEPGDRRDELGERRSRCTLLLDGIEKNLGRKPDEASADSGYLSEASGAACADRDVTACITTGRAKRPGNPKRKLGGPLTQAMRRELKRAAARARPGRWRRRPGAAPRSPDAQHKQWLSRHHARLGCPRAPGRGARPCRSRAR